MSLPFSDITTPSSLILSITPLSKVSPSLRRISFIIAILKRSLTITSVTFGIVAGGEGIGGESNSC